jgi:hypothetical protein
VFKQCGWGTRPHHIVSLLATWGSEDGAQMFCLFSGEGSSDECEQTYKSLALGTKHVPLEMLLRNVEGGSITRVFEGKVNY